jgi:hypothetical protein
MTDLVKRLRRADTCIFPTERDRCHCGEAADRILKLEAALRLYACDCKPDDGCGVEYYDGGANCGRTARKALEGKDD